MTVSATQIAQMRVEIADLANETVAVETYAGETAIGPTYATSANVTCKVDSTRRLVLDREGSEVVSERTLFVSSADETKFTPESRVTFATVVSTVIAVAPKTMRGSTVVVEVNCR